MNASQSDDAGPADLDMVEPPATVCDSCGSEDDRLVRVRRIYLDPHAGGDGDHRILDEDEWWCLPCRTHYPHEAQAF